MLLISLATHVIQKTLLNVISRERSNKHAHSSIIEILLDPNYMCSLNNITQIFYSWISKSKS